MPTVPPRDTWHNIKVMQKEKKEDPFNDMKHAWSESQEEDLTINRRKFWYRDDPGKL